MAVSCAPNDLLKASACVDCIPAGKMQSVIVYLLAVLSGSSTDPNYLMAQARCMDCIPDGYKPAVIIWLLCQIASASPGVLPQIIANLTPGNAPNSVQYPNSLVIYTKNVPNKPDYSSTIQWTINQGGVISEGSGNLTTFLNSVPDGRAVTALKIIEAPGHDPILSPFGMDGFGSLPNLLSLDVSGCYTLNSIPTYEMAQLQYLNCQKCNLNSLQFYDPKAGVPPGIKGVACDFNPGLYSVNAIGCSNLAGLSCEQCNLVSLLLTGCSALSYLNCSQNYLNALDVSTCAYLSSLECGQNLLTSLSVAGLVNLVNLGCDNNQLASLDVSGIPSLLTLFANNNLLTSVTATGSGLLNVFLSGNQLASLSLAGTGVGNLDISNNLFTAFTSPEPMEFLFVNQNQLTVAAVNAILVALSTNGNTGGIVQLQGQNPAAVPTGAGATAVTTLRAETPPWTVTVDISAPPNVSWTPNTAVCQWTDKNGTQRGNLAAFNAAADYGSVSSLNLNNRSLTAISNLSSLTGLQTLLLTNNAGLTSLTLTGCAALTNLVAQSCQLTALNVSPCVKLTSLNLIGNAIAVVANLDAILAALVTNAQINGQCLLSGGTNVTPDAAGLSSISALQTSGWAVTTN